MRKIIIGAASALLVMGTSAFAQGPGWKISEVSGEVRLVENGRARPAARGAMLSSGSTIATGPKARAVIVRGQEFVVISPRTQLRIPAAVQASSGIMQIIEDFGTAVFKIQKKSTPHFGVQTPYLAAVVKGTTFTVTVGPAGSSVQVTEGAVEVSTLDGGASELIRPGGIAQVGASDVYRLTVEAEGSKVIRSEKVVREGDVKGKVSAYVGPSEKPIELVGVRQNDKSLRDFTNDLVDRGGGPEMAHAAAKDLERGRGDGKPADPGNGNPPANPGKGEDENGGEGGGHGQPEEPGKGNGPPTDPGNGNGPPSEPGNGNGPPSDPGNGNGPPSDPGNGNGNPPADPGNGAPSEPGGGKGNAPTEPGNGPPSDAGNGNDPPAAPGNGDGPPTQPNSGQEDDAGRGESGGDKKDDRGADSPRSDEHDG